MGRLLGVYESLRGRGRRRESDAQEGDGGVALIHQLGGGGLHLASREVVDGQTVHHLPGLVLEKHMDKRKQMGKNSIEFSR